MDQDQGDRPQGALDMVRDIVYNTGRTQRDLMFRLLHISHDSTLGANLAGCSINIGREGSDTGGVTARFR